MARTEFSKKTKREGFVRAGGRCEMILADGTRCACKLQVGRFTYDHRIPDRLGGEATIENLQVICQGCDKAKYPNDRRDIDHNRRMSDLHTGIDEPSRPMACGRDSALKRTVGGRTIPRVAKARPTDLPSKRLPPKNLYASGEM